MKILVTGASGFIGKALVREAKKRGLFVRAAVRRTLESEADEQVIVGDLNAETEWQSAVSGCDAVVHLAARVYAVEGREPDRVAAFCAANTAGAGRLARQASAAGVRRLVFMSSIKVHGESTTNRGPFSEADVPAPEDAYAFSKSLAEEALRRIAGETGMELVIIRPPLVYGPGAKANFHLMMRWLQAGVLLPLGAVNNRRSLIALDNLLDLTITCIQHPAAANQIFLAADGEDLSTTELLQRLGAALGRPARLIPVPLWLLQAGAAAMGKGEMARRLCESLQVDAGKARKWLGWMPPVSVDEGLRETARAFLNRDD